MGLGSQDEDIPSDHIDIAPNWPCYRSLTYDKFVVQRLRSELNKLLREVQACVRHRFSLPARYADTSKHTSGTQSVVLTSLILFDRLSNLPVILAFMRYGHSGRLMLCQRFDSRLCKSCLIAWLLHKWSSNPEACGCRLPLSAVKEDNEMMVRVSCCR